MLIVDKNLIWCRLFSDSCCFLLGGCYKVRLTPCTCAATSRQYLRRFCNDHPPLSITSGLAVVAAFVRFRGSCRPPELAGQPGAPDLRSPACAPFRRNKHIARRRAPFCVPRIDLT